MQVSQRRLCCSKIERVEAYLHTLRVRSNIASGRGRCSGQENELQQVLASIVALGAVSSNFSYGVWMAQSLTIWAVDRRGYLSSAASADVATSKRSFQLDVVGEFRSSEAKTRFQD